MLESAIVYPRQIRVVKCLQLIQVRNSKEAESGDCDTLKLMALLVSKAGVRNQRSRKAIVLCISISSACPKVRNSKEAEGDCDYCARRTAEAFRQKQQKPKAIVTPRGTMVGHTRVTRSKQQRSRRCDPSAGRLAHFPSNSKEAGKAI